MKKISIHTTNDFILAHPNLMEKSYSTAQTEYLILYEDSKITNNSDSELENYQSIILENPSRNILSFAPPKTVEYSDLSDFLKSPEFSESIENIHISEFMEGTLIHFFYDSRISSWEIATKHAVGGRYSYYHIPDQYTPTYREMMMEAFHQDRLAEIKTIPFLESLPRNYSYTFVLQHPLNHIVIPIETPKMYLVAVYEISSVDQTMSFISPLEYQKWEVFQTFSKLIYLPTTYSPNDISDIENEKGKTVNSLLKYIQNHASIYTPYYHMGIVFTNVISGKRASFFNPNYMEMAEIRGNHSNLLYQYFCLQRIHKIQPFLHYFPQYQSLFTSYKQNYENLITQIHQYYFTYYVKKSGEKTIPKKFFHHIYNIHHTIFLPSLTNTDKSDKKIIRRSVVKDYIDELDPIILVSLLQSENTFFANTNNHL